MACSKRLEARGASAPENAKTLPTGDVFLQKPPGLGARAAVEADHAAHSPEWW
jgi:hypothetical protein